MKVLLVGASGTIGSIIKEDLQDSAEIITAGRHDADITVDITSEESIRDMFEKVGQVDALINTAGAAHFGPLNEMTPADNRISIESKLLGQINLILLGKDYITDNGSITLTTGVLMDDPIVTAASAAMANGGVRAFIKTAALELPRGIRLNHVSPTMLEASKDQYGDLFQGFEAATSERIALAYRKSVFSGQSGQGFYVY